MQGQSQECMLSSMFSGRYSLEKDEEGCYFIDRDGTHFRYILNFLRDGAIPTITDEATRLELLHEAKFYGLQSLIDALSEIDFSINVLKKCAPYNNTFLRGYEIVPDNDCKLSAVWVSLDMSSPNRGYVTLYNYDGELLQKGSEFIGQGEAWYKSKLQYHLKGQEHYYLITHVPFETTYHYIEYKSNPQPPRMISNFVIFARALKNGSFKSNTFNLFMKICVQNDP